MVSFGDSDVLHRAQLLFSILKVKVSATAVLDRGLKSQSMQNDKMCTSKTGIILGICSH